MGSGRRQWSTARPHTFLAPAPSATILTVLILSGVSYPRFSAACGAAYILGRELYATGYMARGANGRLAGAVIFDVALLLLLGGAIASGLAIANITLAGTVADAKVLLGL